MTVAAITASTHVSARRLRALVRQPYFLAITLLQPMVWLLLFGQLFTRMADLPGFPGDSYITFLTPGVVVMTALFSTGWAGMSLVTDMDRGILDRFLVSPTRRGSLLAGDLGYQAATTLVQAVIILAVGWLAGARYPGGLLGIAVFLVGVILLGTTFAAFSNAIALLLRQEESIIGIVNFIVLPLSFLSSAFLPGDLAPGWIQAVARVNPVNWAVELGREAMSASPDWSAVLERGSALLALALLCAWLSSRAFRAYQRAV